MYGPVLISKMALVFFKFQSKIPKIRNFLSKFKSFFFKRNFVWT